MGVYLSEKRRWEPAFFGQDVGGVGAFFLGGRSTWAAEVQAAWAPGFPTV